MWAKRARVVIDGGDEAVRRAIADYNYHQVWSPDAKVAVNGSFGNWTMRPAVSEEFDGVVVFRNTPGGGELIVITAVPHGFYVHNAVVGLSNNELMVLRMSGARMAVPALAAIRHLHHA